MIGAERRVSCDNFASKLGTLHQTRAYRVSTRMSLRQRSCGKVECGAVAASGVAASDPAAGHRRTRPVARVSASQPLPTRSSTQSCERAVLHPPGLVPERRTTVAPDPKHLRGPAATAPARWLRGECWRCPEPIGSRARGTVPATLIRRTRLGRSSGRRTRTIPVDPAWSAQGWNLSRRGGRNYAVDVGSASGAQKLPILSTRALKTALPALTNRPYHRPSGVAPR
jgi:hypothetical protein